MSNMDPRQIGYLPGCAPNEIRGWHGSTKIIPGEAAILRERMKAKYPTQRAAAIAWGVTDSMVSKVVRGERAPTAEMRRDLGLE